MKLFYRGQEHEPIERKDGYLVSKDGKIMFGHKSKLIPDCVEVVEVVEDPPTEK